MQIISIIGTFILVLLAIHVFQFMTSVQGRFWRTANKNTQNIKKAMEFFRREDKWIVVSELDDTYDNLSKTYGKIKIYTFYDVAGVKQFVIFNGSAKETEESMKKFLSNVNK